MANSSTKRRPVAAVFSDQWSLLCIVILLFTTFTGGCAPPATGWASTTRPYLKAEETVNLLILGDWGTGKPAQRVVANAVETYIRKTGVKFDACLSPGDNFYVELTGIDDPQWQTLFERMYDPEVFDFPFYCVYGNHDYEGTKPQIQLNYARANPQSRFKMPSNWYTVKVPDKRPMVTIFCVDSCRAEMPQSTWQTQRVWLATESAKPKTTPWVIWLAHHPPFSNGKNGDNLTIQADWHDMIKSGGADFFVAGHEHSLQHLEVPGWPSIIVSGGAGQRLVRMRRNDRGPFSRSTYGFVHLSLTPEAAEARLFDADGRLLHLFTRTREGQVNVIATSPSDPKTVGWFRTLFGQ